ncbi:lambda exonuclease family protein [Brachybacterium alimentarium]|uniref:lambda exonuclease family protein n=1 Tax=Brachybacterium alimentarium TaxID=47845 RepID=UPI003FD0E2AB
MTLTVYRELEQGTDEWVQARAGILTASVVGQLITPSTVKPSKSETARGVMLTLLAERLTGHVELIPPSADMERGTLDEPFARDLYAQHYAPVTEVGFAVREINGRQLGASPDGLVGDMGGIEIKSRKPKIQLQTIVDDKIPAANMAQIQCSLLVFDREWWDYVSYAGGWPLYVKRVYPDERWRAAILEALEAYETFSDLVSGVYAARTDGTPIAPRIDHWAEQEMTF